MRFALLGEHPDGLAMARALAATGRHQLLAYSGPKAGWETLRQDGLEAKPTGDMEEVLFDPAIEAVIVASRLDDRAPQLRRALQSERHVLCVHPADLTPDIAYEALMIQGDTKQVLLPLLPEALHPAVGELAEMIRRTNGSLGRVQLIVIESAFTTEAWMDTYWHILRALAGEVVEVSAYAEQEQPTPGEPLLLAGRCQSVLFQGLFLSRQPEAYCRFRLIGS